MIKAIIFDCFGVLAEDGWTPFKRKYIGDNQVLRDQVADLGKQTDRGYISYKDMITATSKLIGVQPDILRAAVGRKVPNEPLLNYIKTKLKPRYKIGMMTNANYDVTKDLFTPSQAELFDASVMSHESGMVKPDKRMYELMAQRLGVFTNECVYVDDIERYCVAAEGIGMHSIYYKELDGVLKELDVLAKSY